MLKQNAFSKTVIVFKHLRFPYEGDHKRLKGCSNL